MSNIKNTINIHSIKLTSKNGDVVDISHICKSVTIIESVFSQFLSGEIILKDTFDIVKNLPLIGGERVEIAFDDGVHGSAMFFEMVIASEPAQINVSTGKDKVENVLLKLKSEAYFNDKLQRISMKFKNTKRDIIEKMVFTYMRSFKPVSMDSSIQDSIEFVANHWFASQIIDYICEQSKDAVFFEHNRQYFIFDTISNLIKKDITNELYVASNFEQSIGLNHVLAYQFDSKFNLDTAFKSFMFGQTVFKPSLENYGFQSKQKTLDDISGSEFPLMGSNKVFNKKFSNNDNNIALTYEDVDSKLYRNMIFQMMKYYNLIVQTKGSSERKAGDMISFDMPSIDNQNSVNANFSGKWMILQIKHTINSTLEYNQVMRLWKNSFNDNPKV